jgi:hypothetical protein
MILAFFLFLQNSKIKEQHRQNMSKLNEIISSLHQKQLLLNDKVTIALDYNSNYTKDMKNIGDEVVVLQKVFLEIISNAKNS